jgi:hypothetical protein
VPPIGKLSDGTAGHTCPERAIVAVAGVEAEAMVEGETSGRSVLMIEETPRNKAPDGVVKLVGAEPGTELGSAVVGTDLSVRSQRLATSLKTYTRGYSDVDHKT